MGLISYWRAGFAKNSARGAIGGFQRLAVAVEAVAYGLEELGRMVDAQAEAIKELEQRVARMEART